MKYRTIMGLYDHIDTSAAAIKPLVESSVKHSDMKILSVAPYPDGTFFEDETPAPIWIFALVGGVIGLVAGVLLAGGTQYVINLDVGAKDTFSWPAVAVIAYETTMLGAVLGTFVSLLWLIGLPNWTDHIYDNTISHGNIGILVRCWEEGMVDKVEQIMKETGAVKIKWGADDF